IKAALAAALLSSTSFTRVFAQSAPFDFEAFTERMKARAAEPFDATVPPLPEAFAKLDYDSYRKVQFDPKHARWAGTDAGYEVHAFWMGWLFKEPVNVFEVANGEARPFDFSLADFKVYDDVLAQHRPDSEPFPGVAGFRVNYPLNKP